MKPLLAVSLSLATLPAPGMLRVGDQSLAPASCATRNTLWIRHYAAALYVPPRASPAAALEDPKVAKALQVEILNKAFLPRQMPQRWQLALAAELDRASLGSIDAAWRRLGAGDRVTIAYAPGPGVSLRVNGRLVAAAPTHRLVDALLHTWAEDEPVSERVSRVVARHPCGR
ncbi:MAG TPA: chalcone isomerase family protein [Burkholderiales bacterium]|nr:chalcone isomerase family protein [Burkholderiales bacterium]